MVWLPIAMLLLWTNPGGCAVNNASHLIEYTAVGFAEKLESGSTIFVYFGHRVSPTISLFLVQLDRSAEALRDYGIAVGKVNCSKEAVAKFCTGEKLLHKGYLFRNAELLKSFDIDSVFDINAIVSHVLFGILFEEVRYAQSDTDLQALEKAAQGKGDLVLAYVQMLGTQEHRSLMETVFVYGGKYQFILTTGGPLLEQLGVSPARSSGVWFLHCKLHMSAVNPVTPERCPLTPMRKPLSTLNLHGFLQLMEAPLVSEAYEDPSVVQPPHLHMSQLFLFSRPSTEHLDLDVAITLAWRLRGLALLTLVHRESPAVKTPEEYNVAYRLPWQGSEVKYLTLGDLEEVMELFADQKRAAEAVGDEDEAEDEDVEEDDEWAELDMLDDEVGEAVFRNRGSSLDMDSVTQLNSDNFHQAVARHGLTVALFYLKWDAVSMAFLGSFIEAANRLTDSEVPGVQMAVVDCGEWTDLCAAQPMSSNLYPFQPIKAFPSVMMLRPREVAQVYTGMLGTEALHHFIMMSLVASPVVLSTQEEVTSFLQEVAWSDPEVYKPHRVLGLFRSHTDAHAAVFCAAAKAWRGEVLTGMLTDGLAEKWATEQASSTPVLLLFRSWGVHARQPTLLPLPSSAEELVTRVNAVLLDDMPELTVDNLPSYLALGKPLLLLFVGEEEEEDEWGRRESRAALEEVRAAAAAAAVAERGGRAGGGLAARYLPCWIHFGHTPAGVSVLKSYLGSLPPLPTLVVSRLSTEEVYHYPPNSPIVACSVLQWLERIDDRKELPTGMMADSSWAPPVPFYDFLSVMDLEAPGYARQTAPKSKEGKGTAAGREEGKERGRMTDAGGGGGAAEGDPSHLLTHSEL